jgi:hypothetical protein
MGADKNSSRRRLKLQQDELTQSDPLCHTLHTSTFRLPKPRSHISATGPRNKHYQQPQLLHTLDSGNNSGAGCCRMDLPGPTALVGTRTDYSVGPRDYSACATWHLMAWSTRTTQE